MPSPLAIALAALLTLSGACFSMSLRGGIDIDLALAPAGSVLIISRPESSDLYLAPRVRIAGAEILERNPNLLRTNEENDPYRLSVAAEESWQRLSRSDLPIVHALDSIQAAMVPEPSNATFLSLSALLLLRRRRPSPLGNERSRKRERFSSAGSGFKQENP